MKLTENFYLSEFTDSTVAARLGIDNTPTEEVIQNIRKLAYFVMQPIRIAINSPVVISSGYRSDKLNRIVKGSRNSDHLSGCAADFVVPGMSTEDVFDTLSDYIYMFPVKQLILETGTSATTGKKVQWIHVSIPQIKHEVFKMEVE